VSDKRFPQISFPYPVKLRAVEENMRDYQIDPMVGTPVKKWHRFLEKLANMEPLTNAERSIGLISANLIPIQFVKSFETLFSQGLDEAYFKKIVQKLTSTLLPEESISILLSVDERFLNDPTSFPQSLRMWKNRTEKFTHLGFAGAIQVSSDPISAIKALRTNPSLQGFSSGQIKIIEALCRLEKVEVFLDRSARELPDFLFSNLEDELVASGHLDRLLAIYLNGKPTWKTDVLSSMKPVGIFVKWILSQAPSRRSVLESRPAIKLVLKAALEINEVLNELQAVEADRASFWRTKLELCSFVIPRTFKKGNAKVGVAFGIGEYVICEFAPSGNAAFLYKARDFELHIKDSDTWRDPSFGQHYPGLTTTNIPGQIRHVGSWQSVLSRLLDAIER
jgi:hypothetical protein